MDPKENNTVTQLDYEGSPLAYSVKRVKLVKETTEEHEHSDHVKSPMPGTVVKVFCNPGD